MKRINIIVLFALSAILYSSQANSKIVASGDDCAAEGASCHWEVDSEGKLTITGSGAMKDYECCGFQPYYKYADKIKTIEVGEGITSTGNRAFQSLYKATSVSLPTSLQSISFLSFDFASTLNTINLAENSNNISIGHGAFKGSGITSIIIPESVETISSMAFAAQNLETLTIPDSVKTIYGNLFVGDNARADNIKEIIIYDSVNTDNWSNTFPEGVVVRCLGDIQKCDDAMKKYGITTLPALEQQCNNIARYYYTGENCASRPEDSILDCAIGYYTDYNDFCYKVKLRYTIPEADKATSNDDENMIEWIFQ